MKYTAWLITISLFLSSCVAVQPTQLTPTATVPATQETIAEPAAGPTPLPTRTAFPPGELVDYVAQTGDSLPALAAHFNTTVEEILAANTNIPPDITTLPAGLPMKIPIYYVPLIGSPFQILPDSEVVNSPSAVGFDIEAELEATSGFLKDIFDYGYYRERAAWDVIDVLSRNYSVHPRLLIALLEYRTQAVSRSEVGETDLIYPLGYEDPKYQGLYRQLLWAVELINDGYYGWRTGTLDMIKLADGRLVRPDPWQNAGTVAIYQLFAALYGQAEFDIAVGPDGFYNTYKALWGEPFDQAVDFIPGNLVQPELALPFEPGKIWDFTAGPHYSWGIALPYGALDFAPPAVLGGCASSAEWVTAPAAGVVTRSELAMVILDLDGDGDQRTGWVLFFFHIAENDRIAAGLKVEEGVFLGHPSCEGGRSTGTHVHIARIFNGEWIPAGGVLPFTMDGWVADYGSAPYEGTLTKVSKVVRASTLPTFENQIYYALPSPE
ncbi:MAG: LysM peptidoglycan-binding domain-containing protein [Anaerolineales bacterium]|nr:LysM peptidoglycan-binding domain-containing protein [Anaerolineales bacterium]